VAKTAAVFDRAADHFDDPVLGFWDVVGRATVDRIGVAPGDRVLDVCCGTGASALPAAERVGPTGDVLGVDVAERLLDLARAKAAARGLPARFEVRDARATGLPDGAFDAVLCVFGIFFLPDMDGAAAELVRVTRPGGRIAITTWADGPLTPATRIFREEVRAERPDLWNEPPPWVRLTEPAALMDLLSGAGAGPVAVERLDFVQALADPEDFWRIVLGSGFVEFVDLVGPEAAERVRRATIARLHDGGVVALDVPILVATAERPPA